MNINDFILASKLNGSGGGGGGGGALIVTYNNGCDKTFGEIIEAFMAGKTVILMSNLYPEDPAIGDYTSCVGYYVSGDPEYGYYGGVYFGTSTMVASGEAGQPVSSLYAAYPEFSD